MRIHKLAAALTVALLAVACARPLPRPAPETPPGPAPALPPPVARTPEPEGPQPVQTPPLPPPAQAPSAVFRSFLASVQEGNADAAWATLSPATQQIMGGTAAQFAAGRLADLQAAYGGWDSYRIALEDTVDNNLAVVAIAGDKAANGTVRRNEVAAVALVKGDAGWRISLGVGPTLSIVTPQPGEAVNPADRRVAFLATGQAPLSLARLWLNGKAVVSQPGTGQSRITVSHPLPGTLAPGAQIAVALAADQRGNPAALGWTFRAE